MLTVITEVFGVRGEIGDMVISPKLLKEQFDSEGNAGLRLRFAGKAFHIIFKNPGKLTYGDYLIKSAVCDGQSELEHRGDRVCLDRKIIDSLPDVLHEIVVELK